MAGLSVIIAAFDAEATLPRAIESVLAQGDSSVEVVVVDDGSRDDTGQIARSYGPPVRCLRQDNAGVAAARNRGVAEASGHWVAFLDADDWYYPGRVRGQRELIQLHPDVDFCIGNYRYVGSDGVPLREAMAETDLGRELLSAGEGLPFAVVSRDRFGRLVTEYFGHTSTFSMPRELFLRLGGYPLGIRVGEDLNLLIRACAASRRIGVMLEPLGAYVVHDAGLVRSDRVDAQRETVAALEPLVGSLQEAPPALKQGLNERLRGARMDLATALLRDGKRGPALRVLLPQLATNPGWRSLRDLLTVLLG
jgi:glycosyltransferase involved in cell wall biosynthesis